MEILTNVLAGLGFGLVVLMIVEGIRAIARHNRRTLERRRVLEQLDRSDRW